jgi:hypothetical protein
VLFEGLAAKPVTVRFEDERTSSDGGAILLKAADRRMGMIASIAESFTDRRDSSRVRHEIEEILSQRIFGIACGYEDGNDAARIASDPVMKTLAGRDPFGADLASQPSISRFERSATQKDLFRMSMSLMKTVVHAQRRGREGWSKRITIDLDQTPTPTHGGQQLTFFNGHYDTYCYIPLVAAISFAGEPDQFVVASVLRPGNAPDKRGAISLLSRLLPVLREAFPKAKLAVRFDAGFCAPEILDYVEEQRLDYVIAFPANAVLDRASEILMSEVRFLASKSRTTEHRYAETTYQSRSWTRERRVIFKAEVTQIDGRAAKDNPRYVVTNMRGSAQHIYENIYCRRGQFENRLKELKNDLCMDRTSCSAFLANQLRVLMTTAAFALFQEIRRRAAQLARATVSRMRIELIKLAARVTSSARRIVLHLPRHFAYRDEWLAIAPPLTS